jgi:hypothetical protein
LRLRAFALKKEMKRYAAFDLPSTGTGCPIREGGTQIRAGAALFNDKDDVERFLEAAEEVMNTGKKRKVAKAQRRKGGEVEECKKGDGKIGGDGMNQELLTNLSPYLLLSPCPPCIGFSSLRPCAFASLR